MLRKNDQKSLPPATINDIDYERGGYVIIPLVSEDGDGSPTDICDYCMFGSATQCLHNDTIFEVDEGEFIGQICIGFILDEINLDNACTAGVVLGDYDPDCALRVYRHIYDPLSSPIDEAKSGIEEIWESYYYETDAVPTACASTKEETDKKKSHITVVKNKKVAIFMEGVGNSIISSVEEIL